MPRARELQRRWLEPGGPALERAVKAWLCDGAERPSGLGEVDGRVDLRGISLTSLPTEVGERDPAGSAGSAGPVWESLDLRGATVDELRLFAATLRDCLFDKASCVGWRVWGTTVEDCSFRGADLRSRGLGGGGPWNGRLTRWQRVAFDKAKMRESAFTGCVVDRCSFDSPGRRLQFQDCELHELVVRGEAHELIVDGRGLSLEAGSVDPGLSRRMSGDLSGAVFRDAHIVGYHVDDVVLPTQDNLRIVPSFATNLPVILEPLAASDDESVRLGATVWSRWLPHAGVAGTDLVMDTAYFDAADGAAVRALDASMAAVLGRRESS